MAAWIVKTCGSRCTARSEVLAGLGELARGRQPSQVAAYLRSVGLAGPFRGL